jgi:dTDP-4-amino-4,6-dideoxygalactose transaminase
MIPYFPQGTLLPEREFVHGLVRDVVTSREYILKGRCRRLEEFVCAETGAGDAVAVASGTGALGLCLHAAGMEPGDEVVVPAFCFAAVANTVANLRATPVFADCAPGSAVVGAEQIAACLTDRTRAIVVAHLFSWLVDMPAVVAVAKRAGIRLIEDAAVAFGADAAGKPAGLWGDLGVYSFFPVKPAGGLAEGGMIVGADADLMRRCRWLRNHGQDGVTRFVHHLVGYNCRMDEIAAGFLLHRLQGLPGRLRRRAEIAAYYADRLRNLAPRLVLPPIAGDRGLNYVYVVQSANRDVLARDLSARGVETQTYYTPILPRQPVFARPTARLSDFPNAESMATRHLALPLYPELTDAQIEHVADAMKAFHA